MIPGIPVGQIYAGYQAVKGLYGTWDEWDKPGGGGEVFAKAGTGASAYEKAANNIAAAILVLDIAGNILDVVGGICGVVTAAAMIAAFFSFGALAPLALAAGKITLAIGIVSTLISAIKSALQPLVLLFRSLHAFKSQADPRDVKSQGSELSAAGGAIGGTLAGMAASKAIERLDSPRPDPTTDHDEPPRPPPKSEGPEVVVEPHPVTADPVTGALTRGEGPESVPIPTGAPDKSGLELDTGPRQPAPESDYGNVPLQAGGPDLELATPVRQAEAGPPTPSGGGEGPAAPGGAGGGGDAGGPPGGGRYIPRDEQGNPIPLAVQWQDPNQVGKPGTGIPLPAPEAEGRPHTVLGGKVSSESGEEYRQSATFSEQGNTTTLQGFGPTGERLPSPEPVPVGRVDWGSHGHPVRDDAQGHAVHHADPHIHGYSTEGHHPYRIVEEGPRGFFVPTDEPSGGPPAGGGAPAPPPAAPPAGGGGPPPPAPDLETAAPGRGRGDVRAQAREIEMAQVREDVESGIRRPTTEMLEQDIGRDRLVDLAEGKISQSQAEVEVHHKRHLSEEPELGTDPSNLEALHKPAHRQGAHGNKFAEARGGIPADPHFDEAPPLQSVPRRGEPHLDPAEIQQRADQEAVNQFREQEQYKDEVRDREVPTFEDEKLGKGRGGPRLSESERAARDQAAQDRVILAEQERTAAALRGKAENLGDTPAGARAAAEADRYEAAVEELRGRLGGTPTGGGGTPPSGGGGSAPPPPPSGGAGPPPAGPAGGGPEAAPAPLPKVIVDEAALGLPPGSVQTTEPARPPEGPAPPPLSPSGLPVHDPRFIEQIGLNPKTGRTYNPDSADPIDHPPAKRQWASFDPSVPGFDPADPGKHPHGPYQGTQGMEITDPHTGKRVWKPEAYLEWNEPRVDPATGKDMPYHGVRAGPGGAWHDHVFRPEEGPQSQAYADSLAAQGRERIREQSALPEGWPADKAGTVAPGNPVDNANVYPIEGGFVSIRSVVAPQPEGAPSATTPAMYAGGGPQTQIPSRRVHPGTPATYSTPIKPPAGAGGGGAPPGGGGPAPAAPKPAPAGGTPSAPPAPPPESALRAGERAQRQTTGAGAKPAEGGVERVSPAYPPPPGTPQQLASMRASIRAALEARANAAKDAQQSRQTEGQLRKREQGAKQLGAETAAMLVSHQAHQQTTSERMQANTQERTQIASAEAQVKRGASQLAGTATLEVLLTGWAGFTSLAEDWLPGAASRAFGDMNRDATKFMAQLAEVKGLMGQEQAAGPVHQATNTGNRAQLDATRAQASQTGQTLAAAKQAAARSQSEHAEERKAAEQRGEQADQDVAEAAATAQSAQEQHDALLEQLVAWAELHKAARQAAVESTVERVTAEGRVVRSRSTS